MTLSTFRNGTSIFSRFESTDMFSIFIENIGAGLSDDKDVNIWLNALKNDPPVKLASNILSELDYYGKTALVVATSVSRLATAPVTSVLRGFFKPEKVKLTDCPFEPRKAGEISQKGHLIPSRLTLSDRCKVLMDDISFRSKYSRHWFTRLPFKIIHCVLSIPSYLKFGTQDAEVIKAIQEYYPSFNDIDFGEWLENSFLPFFVDNYIKLNIFELQRVASPSIVKEIQLSLEEKVKMDRFINGRVLNIEKLEFEGFKFEKKRPVIFIRFIANFVREERSHKKDVTISGDPQNVISTTFLASIGIDDSGDTPRFVILEAQSFGEVGRI